MMARSYRLQQVDCGALGRRPMHRFTCGRCGKIHDVAPPGTGAPMPGVFLEKKMRAGGWRIGRGADRDLCPDCVMAMLKARRKPDLTADVTGIGPLPGLNAPQEFPSIRTMTWREAKMTAEPVHADAPAAPTREDRRVIIAKLEDVYLDEKTGYSSLWSDTKVAENLGVPRKWVTDVREDLFGPEGSSEGARELIGEARSIQAAYEDLGKSAKSAHALLAAEAKKLAEREAAFSRRLVEMQRALG